MQRTLGLLFSFLFLSLNAQQLSEQAEISVLTIAPGLSLNDAFGHNAFRIKDKKNNLDQTFDYGRFDFEAPNFYLNFARGKLNYSIGDALGYNVISHYIRQNRGVKEQILNLSQSQKQKLYDFLVNNNKPENRNYLYDFFYDNCATKIKDVTNIASNNTVTFNIPDNYQEATFRTLIQNNLNRNSWGSLGIDLALGAVIDRTATPEQQMFLPENIYRFFESASVGKGKKPLVKESRVLYKQKPQHNNSNLMVSPLFILGIISILILFITYQDHKHQKRTKFLDIVLFTFTGLIGVAILLLWFATDHQGTRQNYNLLWANALNLIVVFQLFRTKASVWFVKYLKLLIILLCLLVLHWSIGVQVFAIGLIPLLVALFVRYIFLVNHYNRL